MLLEEARTLPAPADESDGAVPIDHFFNVKGVGTVILGLRGLWEDPQHDDLKVLPTNQERPGPVDPEARRRLRRRRPGGPGRAGPQEHRRRAAGPRLRADQGPQGQERYHGHRPGRAGQLLEDRRSRRAWSSTWVTGCSSSAPGWSRSRTPGTSGGRRVTLSLDKPVVHPPGSRAVLMYLEGGKLRVARLARPPMTGNNSLIGATDTGRGEEWTSRSTPSI